MSEIPQSGVVARLSADERTARRIAEMLSQNFDDAAVSAFEDGKAWIVEAIFPNAPDTSAVRRVVGAAADRTAANALTFASLAARDWVSLSLVGLSPVNAGRFFIHGAHDRARIPPNRIALEIEAALAFGTGHHGTTRGCLLALDAIVTAQRTSSRRPRILDVGTGTGILAIAAARALHAAVLATDIDTAAVRAAHDNARRNHAGARVTAVHAGNLAYRRVRAGAPYDLILANILAAPLIRMSADAASLLAPGGRIVLSGLLNTQASALVSTYRAQGLLLERRIPLDGWVTLIMRRAPRRF
jgi:ribosomal protein L11 methyltransferase